MRAFRPPLLLAVLVLATACGDSSPMSPFSGAASLVEEAIGTSQSPIDIRTERVTFVAPAGGGELRVGAAEAARSPRIRASPPPQVAPRSPNAIRATPG